MARPSTRQTFNILLFEWKTNLTAKCSSVFQHNAQELFK